VAGIALNAGDSDFLRLIPPQKEKSEPRDLGCYGIKETPIKMLDALCGASIRFALDGLFHDAHPVFVTINDL
jgi:hypothetical protein